MPAADLHLTGVIALELVPGATIGRAALDPAGAGALAARLGHDLALLVPGIDALDLTFGAAHFDPAEALRPGWPLHRRLEELRARAPGRDRGARVIALGADASGDIPQPLQADPMLAGGALRVLPFLVSGNDAAEVARVGDAVEELLVDRGMARAETALLAQDAFGTQVEHMRYLTLHDLLAMTALQYGHMGLDPLWPLLESALLAPDETAWLDAPPEPLVRVAGGEAHIALFTPEAWRERHAATDTDVARIDRAMRHFEARQRQFAAVLEAHGVPVTFDCCTRLADARAALA